MQHRVQLAAQLASRTLVPTVKISCFHDRISPHPPYPQYIAIDVVLKTSDDFDEKYYLEDFHDFKTTKQSSVFCTGTYHEENPRFTAIPSINGLTRPGGALLSREQFQSCECGRKIDETKAQEYFVVVKVLFGGALATLYVLLGG